MILDSVELRKQFQQWQHLSGCRSEPGGLLSFPPATSPGPSCFSVTPRNNSHTFLNSHSQGEGICWVKFVIIQQEIPTDGYHRFKDLLHNLWGLVQNENVGPLIENYLEFQDGLSRALLSMGPSVTSQVACLWPVLVGRGSKTKVII